MLRTSCAAGEIWRSGIRRFIASGTDTPVMEIHVRCYGRVKQALGTRRTTVTLPERSTVGDLLRTLENSYEEFDPDSLTGPSGLIVMRAREHVDEETPLSAGDIVAISDSPMVES